MRLQKRFAFKGEGTPGGRKALLRWVCLGGAGSNGEILLKGCGAVLPIGITSLPLVAEGPRAAGWTRARGMPGSSGWLHLITPG